MAQGGLARKEMSSHTYQVSQPQRKKSPNHTEPIKLGLSGFEKLLISMGICMTFFLLISIVSTKNALNVSQRSLQNITSQKAHLNDENQSMRQELDGMENDAINRIVKKDNLSIANSNVRDVTR